MNEFRKDFTPSERVEIGKALEGELAQRHGGDRSAQQGGKNSTLNDAPVGKTRDLAAKAAGFGNGKTYEQRAYPAPMCNRYETPESREIERMWHVGRDQPNRWWDKDVFPRGKGAFIRHAVDDPDYSRELVVGTWGLIPWFAKEPKLKYSTNNARSEELAAKATYKQPWAKGQRCIIPATEFFEPNWESGKNVWWRFKRADGDPWGLAGLWNTWIDRATGEVHESYTMLTVNADSHPLMSRMHKPDPKLPADQQDKRSVIAIEASDVDLWLTGTVEQTRALLRPPAVGVLAATSLS